jgi:hypothetical protein
MKDAKGIDKQWVVLSELASKLIKEGKPVSNDAISKIRIAKNIIHFYLMDEHAGFESLRDAEKELSQVQMMLFGLCDMDTAKEYLDKMGKACKNELDVEFPMDKSVFNAEIKRKKDVETIRIKLNRELHSEILGELSEWYGVIFENSKEESDKIIIEGKKELITRALKDFLAIWNA